ncbi:MAG TPA: M23 family metallopeptidase [Candidatus Acidoferrales bacterium]
MSRRLVILSLVLILTGGVWIGTVLDQRDHFEQQLREEARLAAEHAEEIRRNVVLYTESRFPFGKTFSDLLMNLGVDRATAFQMVQQTRPVYDLRRVYAGNRVAVGRSPEGELRAVRYQIDVDRELWIAPRGAEFAAEIKEIPAIVEEVSVQGEVRDALFNAVKAAGEGPELALRLADIFGWDVDFNTDTRPGDTFRLVVEKKRYLNGQPPRYGDVLVAEYNNRGTAYQAILFRDPNGFPAYYAPDGASMKKAFLRSPLEFGGRITSRFSYNRFHPILKVRRPHLAIDYAAPVGTPVQAIGDGTVIFAGRKRAEGGFVHLRHANGFETMYLHLSRILVRPGQRVVQGTRIGLVGSTGLSSGPHLDFRVLQHGKYRNFEALRLPPAKPVAAGDMAEFRAVREQLLARLPLRPGDAIRAAAGAADSTPAESGSDDR